MSKITAIETQKKRGDRKSIFVDGEFVAGVHEDVVLTLGLAVGQFFEKAQLEELLRTEMLRKARESAYRLLGYRDRSVAEVRKRLIRKDFPEDIVDEVIDQLENNGLLDDQKFSRDWVRSRTASKPMGRVKLAWELRAKGVDASTVDEAVESVDEEDEYKMARSLAERRLRNADCEDPSVREKLASFLRRRGFGWDVISRVLSDLCPENQD